MISFQCNRTYVVYENIVNPDLCMKIQMKVERFDDS